MHSGESSSVVTDDGVVELVGEHDIASAPKLRLVLEHAATMSSGSLEVDLRRATFIDSSVVRVIVGSARELVAHGRGVVLRVEEGSAPAAVFAIVGLGDQAGIVIESISAPPADIGHRTAPGN
jgi:anti-anti-sigma factor